MQNTINVNEKLLTYYWKNLWFNKQSLFDYFGNAIEILHPGTLNISSGPDFSECRIKINGLIWIGNVELHVRSSDFIKHKHCNDKNYENLLLHVVWEDDLKNEDLLRNRFLATIELKERIQNVAKKFNRTSGIPCRASFMTDKKFELERWLEKLVQERWQEKQKRNQYLLKELKGDKELWIVCLMAKYLGGTHNGNMMMDLVKRIPKALVQKIKGDKSLSLCLILGLAGLSNNNEFLYLKKVYGLQESQKHTWKRTGMYAPGMPQNRLVQLSVLLAAEVKWYDFFLENHANAIHAFFESLSVKFSSSLIERVIINVVLPLKNKEDYLSELKVLKPETNSIISNMGIEKRGNANAFNSQALLQLYTMYCSKKKCLHCVYGKFYLKNA